MKDLIALAACTSIKVVMQALPSRAIHLGVRAFSIDVITHPDRDPGVLRNGHTLLRAELRNYNYALAICDRSGCGMEHLSREKLEERMEDRLRQNGWEDRAAAIVIDPELEAWMWGDWTATSEVLRWPEDKGLREWLIEAELFGADDSKPSDPKMALERAAQSARRQWSSAIHRQIAERSRFERCIDPGFLKLQSVLRRWFPEPTA